MVTQPEALRLIEMVETVLGTLMGAFAGYLFQRRQELDKTIVTLRTETAVAQTALSKGIEHIAKELCAIRGVLHEEQVLRAQDRRETNARIRRCEDAIVQIESKCRLPLSTFTGDP